MSAEELFKKAEKMLDDEESVCRGYLWLLERLFEASFNLSQANNNKEFCDALGGIEKFKNELDEIVKAMMLYHRETEGD